MADLITRLKADVSNHNKGFSSAENALDKYKKQASSLDGTITNAIGTLGKYVSVTAAVTTALKVAKDAFKSSEEAMDEWGRITKSAETAYSTFLSTISSGDWSGFFSKLNDAINGGRELYDIFDALGSMKTNNSALVAVLNNKLNDLRLQKQQGKDVDAAIKSINAQLAGIKGREVAIGKQANHEGFITTLTSRGVSKKLAEEFWNDVTTKEGDVAFTKARTQRGVLAMDALRGDKNAEKLRDQYDKIINAEGELAQYIQGYAQAVNENSAALKQQYKVANWGASSGGGKSGGKGGDTGGKTTNTEVPAVDPSAFLPEDITETTEAFRIIGENWGKTVAKALKESLEADLTTLPESVNKGLSVVNATYEESLKNAKNDLAVKQAASTEKAWQGAASAMSSVGSALQNIEDPGAKVAGILAQAVASVMSGFATALASPVNSAGGVWSWIAAAAAGMATAVATVAEIKSVGQFADGGVIGGNSYVGDKLFARVNSGETILNASEAQRALDMMDAPGGRFGGGNSTISGEQIVTVINNYGRRTGRGEILR